MNRTAVIALLALFLLSSCHDEQKADNQTVMFATALAAKRLNELDDKVQDLQERIEKLENLEKGRDH